MRPTRRWRPWPATVYGSPILSLWAVCRGTSLISTMASPFRGRLFRDLGLFSTYLAGRFKQLLFVGLYIVTHKASEWYYSMVLSRGICSLRIKFHLLQLDEPTVWIVGDSENSVNLLAIPVESRRPCGTSSNLNSVKHLWDIYMFSFCKYAALILPPRGA